MSRYDSIESPVLCMIRIFKNEKWYQLRPLDCSMAKSRKIIARLRRMGRIVNVTWLSGMGLGE